MDSSPDDAPKTKAEKKFSNSPDFAKAEIRGRIIHSVDGTALSFDTGKNWYPTDKTRVADAEPLIGDLAYCNESPGEGLGLLEKGLGCTLPESQQEGGFRLAPEAPGSIPMERLSAPERTREELRALMNGDLGTAAGRSDLVRLALRLIVEEALEGEVSDVLGRERYERGEGEKAGYRKGYRTGKVKTAEGAVEYSAPQVRDTPDSGDVRTEKEQRINRPAHWGSARGEGARPGRGARGETAGCSRALKWSISQNCGGASSPRAVLPPTRGRKGRAFRG